MSSKGHISLFGAIERRILEQKHRGMLESHLFVFRTPGLEKNRARSSFGELVLIDISSLGGIQTAFLKFGIKSTITEFNSTWIENLQYLREMNFTSFKIFVTNCFGESNYYIE